MEDTVERVAAKRLIFSKYSSKARLTTKNTIMKHWSSTVGLNNVLVHSPPHPPKKSFDV